MKIIISAAMTVDGKIATKKGNSAISSYVDLKRVHRLRDMVDAIMVGISTVMMDDPQLTVRLGRMPSKHPTRVIVDSSGRIPLDSKILKNAHEINTIVAVSNRASFHNIHKIENTGAKVIIAGCDNVDLRKVFRLFEKMGYKKVLVEGGGELNWSVLKLGIVNELIVTISPRIIGGRSAITLVEGEGWNQISEGFLLKLSGVRRHMNGELVLHYTT